MFPRVITKSPRGEPAVKRKGKDITLITVGATLYEAVKAADILEEKHGISAEVMDLRFLNPLNYDPIIESVKKTGKVLLSSDASERGSFLHNVASNISRLAFDYLDAPPVVVGSKNWITPPAEMEDLFFPKASWIIDAINENILPISGYSETSNQTDGELVRQSREGV